MMSSRLFVIAALLVFAMSAAFVASRLSTGIDTNILSLLPGDAHDPVLADALQKASSDAANRVAFAIEGGTPAQRSRAANELAAALETSGYFRPASSDARELWDWLFSRRATLLCAGDRAKLEAGEGSIVARNALMEWYAPVTTVSPDALQNDPLLRTNRLLGCLLPQSFGLAPKGEAALLTGSITGAIYRLDVQDKIASVVDAWQASEAARGLSLSRAGAIFHATYGAAHARSEMTIIGGITTIAVLLFYWLMFQSLRAPFIAVGMVVFSLTIGLAAALAIFGGVHAMALVFGAALIGMVVDYTTYYLVTGLASQDVSVETRKAKLFKPLTLGMVTSVAAFAALLLFPVTAFRQIALFGSVGLVAAWVATLVLTPRAEGGAMKVGPGALRVKRIAGTFLAQRFSFRAVVTISLGCLILLGIGYMRGETLDDVRRFQAPSTELVAEEARIRELTGFAPSSSFFLVRGDTRDENVAREEALLAALHERGEENAVVWAAGRFDPSRAVQAAGAALIREKLLEPHLLGILAALGGGNANAYSDLGRKVPLPGFVQALRGETGGVFWSIAPISGSVDGLPDLAGVEQVVPARRYSDLLAQYRWLATWGLVGAVFGTGLMLLAVYRQLSSLRVLLPTALALAVTPAIMAIVGIPYSFFSAMGLFLVAGAGVDYAIFQWESPGREGDWTRVGIVLAAAMTCISVGLLGLSSVLPVRSFGLTVATGVLISLLFSPLVRGWADGQTPGGANDD
tara:strand:+ start:6359 stop:8593 length:2235 start_codon:yes stop_codon:yes gene_type:complete